MCIKCKSYNIIEITAQISKLSGSYRLPLIHKTDIISAMGLGTNNKLCFKLCLDCGTIQHHFPVTMPIDYEKIEPEQEEFLVPIKTQYSGFFSSLKELTGKVINPNKKLRI
jgi:hypothetical protein